MPTLSKNLKGNLWITGFIFVLVLGFGLGIYILFDSKPKIVSASEDFLFITQNTPFEAGFGAKNDPAQIVFKKDGTVLTFRLPFENINWEIKAGKLIADIGDMAFYYSLLQEKGDILGIKEEIVLKKRTEENEFNFSLDLQGLEAKRKDGLWRFYNEEGKEVFYIPKPFMEDAKGAKSEEVEISIEKGKLKVSVEKQWLKDEKRVYPVIIDPSFEITILNVYSHPQAGDNWEVSFETEGTADLTITPDDQATIDDLDFVSLTCDSVERTPQILENDVIFYSNWECDGIGEITHLVNVAGKHTLKFQFSDQIAYAYNQSYEDFTTWTEVGESSTLTQTSTRSTWDQLIRDTTKELYEDYGAGNLGSAWTWEFQFYVSQVEEGDEDDRAIIRLIRIEGSVTFVEIILRQTTVDNEFYVKWSHGTTDETGTIKFYDDTMYYVTIIKDGNTAEVYLYTDSNRTSLRDSYAATYTDAGTYQYIRAPAAVDQGNDGNDYSSGYLEYLNLDAGVVAPTVTTQAASSVEDTTATGNGNITATGGEDCDIRGIVWDLSTHGDPGDTSPAASDYANDVDESGTFGTGAFTRSLTGLPTGDTIYARAYAHNSEGYAYGAEVNFLTKPAAPTNVAATDGDHSDKVVITWTKSTGATGYKVYEGDNLLDTLGDVATYDDTDASAPTITAGDTVAGDGASTAHVSLSLSGTSTSDGASRTYKVVALNATGDSSYSDTNVGYRGPGDLTYQWQRSAADSDDDYGNIDGATSSTHNDTAAPAPTITSGTAAASDGTSPDYVSLSLSGQSTTIGDGRHYKCILNASGCDEQISSSNRGYRGVGSLTYQWQRSAADSDDDYGNIDGATTASYDDTGAPADTSGRYYKCVENADGADQQISTNDRGYRSIKPPSNCIVKETSGGGGPLTIEWSDNSDVETGFEIDKNIDAGGWAGLITKDPDVTSHEDSSVSNDHTYQYRIRANTAAEDSTWCITAVVDLGVGSFKFEGLKLEDLKIDWWYNPRSPHPFADKIRFYYQA